MGSLSVMITCLEVMMDRRADIALLAVCGVCCLFAVCCSCRCLCALAVLWLCTYDLGIAADVQVSARLLVLLS